MSPSYAVPGILKASGTAARKAKARQGVETVLRSAELPEPKKGEPFTHALVLREVRIACESCVVTLEVGDLIDDMSLVRTVVEADCGPALRLLTQRQVDEIEAANRARIENRPVVLQ
jgi:hypothetical protein